MSFRISLFKPTFLASCVFIAACGGGGSDPEPTVDVSGKIADGYLSGAKVCLDLNNNKICDDGEPSAISGAGGAFNLTATQAQINTYPLVVEVVVGTIDEDTNTPIDKPYVMSAPVGSDFVSPLTTMVQTKIDANPSLSVTDAESLVQQNLGTSLSLFEDYIASAADSTNTDAAEFEQLHNIARVTASVIADNYEAVTTAAAATNTSLDILIQIIVESVIAELSNIVASVESVESAGETFDESSVTTISETINNTDLTTLEETIAEVEQEQETPSTEVSSLLALLQSGLNWFDNWDGGYEYGTLSADQDNNISDLFYGYNNGIWELDTSSGSADEDLILTDSGWMNEGSLTISVTVEADGSLQFNNTEDLDKLTGAVEVDISGQNIATIDTDFPADAVDANATFSTGAIGYQLTGLSKEIYGIGHWNDGQCTVLSSSGTGTNCVSIHDINANPATDLASTIGHAHSLGDDLNYTLEGTGTDTNGTVSYQRVSTSASLTPSTWSLQTINGEELIVLDIPTDVQPLTWDVDPTKAFHTVYDGYARLGWYEAGGVFEELLFNSVAMQDILDNFVGGSSASDGSTITDLTMTPNNSVSLSVNSGNLYLPELLGNNSIQAEYGDGSTVTLECVMHHYNAEAGEHILHCTSPSDGSDVYLALSSSNSSVISFTYEDIGEYFMSYWLPVASGTTQITATLPFDNSNASLSWNVDLVLDGGSSSNLSCAYESGWDDLADGGAAGAPINPNSFADFEAVIADCGTALTFTYNDLAGASFGDFDGTVTFSNSGSGTEQLPGTGQFSGPNETIDFEWYLEAATCTNCNYTQLVIYSNETIDADLAGGIWFRDTQVITGITGTPGQAGAVYSKVIYTEQFNFSDAERAVGSDGEIWNTTDTLQ